MDLHFRFRLNVLVSRKKCSVVKHPVVSISLGSSTAADGKARVPQAAQGGACPVSSGEAGWWWWWWFWVANKGNTAGEVATRFCDDSSVATQARTTARIQGRRKRSEENSLQL
ncbi:hypothetical protein JTE90_014115 [Oedothorax gibbosus]|uniref:Uncharacterized protein n=1 Tax=Oedothorax gibbosus TaxID=931172 RepID=A0AAV6V6Q7_9ARAC|nr:hypothetical protein JTE90_014115 [Oedothorax gibbosus]